VQEDRALMAPIGPSFSQEDLLLHKEEGESIASSNDWQYFQERRK